MPNIDRIVKPSRVQGSVLSESGELLTPPKNWGFLPAGDATITKTVKSKGPTWVVRVRKGRRDISKGIWAQETHIITSQKEVEAKRTTVEYKKKREKELVRRQTKQNTYVNDFFTEVVTFLDFHLKYQNEAKLFAEKVTEHATPIGSGTVARTKLIPIAKRAEAAVIAWMRHQTTAYESMRIMRIKGKRREVRRHLASKSVEILNAYRKGIEIAVNCPLKKVLE